MNSIDRINMVIDYIEQKLHGELDEKGIARIAGCSFQQFQRIFSFITGMPLHEYIRKRKLTVAAIELRHGQQNVIDIAVRYGAVMIGLNVFYKNSVFCDMIKMKKLYNRPVLELAKHKQT